MLYLNHGLYFKQKKKIPSHELAAILNTLIAINIIYTTRTSYVNFQSALVYEWWLAIIHVQLIIVGYIVLVFVPLFTEVGLPRY